MKLKIVKPDNKEFDGGWGEDNSVVSNNKVGPKLKINNNPKGFESRGEVNNTAAVPKLKLKLGNKQAVQYQGRTAADTKLWTPRTHVYNRPEMYIGANADILVDQEMWLYNTEEKKIYKAMIKFVPGIERIFLEILSNASDNANMSRRKRTDAGEVNVLMTNNMISIINYGLPMPIETHPDDPTKYIPELSFGRLLTSAHYEGERNESGTNGVGSKATNIFSKKFTCIIHDSVRHLKYTQNWYNNMRVVEEPEILPYNGKISSVQIIYEMDFARFGYPLPNGNEGGYPKEIFHLFARHVLDLSFNAKIVTTFNELKFNVSNIKDYGKLYYGDLVKTAVIHYQWPAGTEVIKKKEGHQVSKDPSILPEVELLALDTPDNGYHVSFANCLMTKDGGIHVNAAIKAVGDSTVKMINEEVFAKINKSRKKDEKPITININNVKPHISILLSFKCKDPKFDAQEKSKLLDCKPKPKIKIPDEILKNVKKWKLADRLNNELEAKQLIQMKKEDGKQMNIGKLPKGVRANQSKSTSKTERHKCTLYITEGKSGAQYIVNLITLLPGGLDYAGYLPMRGKNLNVMNAELAQIWKNKEFNALKKMLGLVEGTDYLIQENFDQLRYGCLKIAADSDVDGKHITGLILTYFHCRFPGLLARGFVVDYLTPIVSFKRGNQIARFYNEVSCEIWKSITPDWEKWEPKYYKGLATSKKEDIKLDFNDPHFYYFFYDMDAPEALSKTFAFGREDDRKEWLANYQPALIEPIYNESFPISQFIDTEMILHAKDNVERTIPRLLDGLKQGHRKIIYAVHLKWKIGSKKKTYKELKIAQLAGFVAEKTSYHHGEVILGNTIVGMTQDFIGSNNIPYLAQGGMCGSRDDLGKNAGQTRYIYTNPMPIFSAIFNKKDCASWDHLYEEGEKIEPKDFLQVVPMILINGATGIGTGWSSYTAPHNPLDIIKCLRLLLNGASYNDLPRLIPWFRGFKGNIEIKERKTKAEVKAELEKEGDEDEELPEEFKDEIHFGKKQLYSMRITGNFEVRNDGTIIITELPIGRSPFKYLKWIEDLMEKKKIKDYRNLSGDNKVYFEIYGFTGQATHKSLFLEKTMGLSNMVLLDKDNKPVKYDNANHILTKFYELRLPYYQIRKNNQLSKIDSDIITMNYKIKFYRAVIDKEIKVRNVKIAYVHEKMDERGIPHEIYSRAGLNSISEDKIIELLKEIENKQQERADLEKLTIQEMWLQDLNEFETVYRREFKIKDNVVKLKVGNKIPVAVNNPDENKIVVKPTIKLANPNFTTGKQAVKLRVNNNATVNPTINSATNEKTVKLKIAK